MDLAKKILSIWLKLQGMVVALMVMLAAVWSAQLTWLFLEPVPDVVVPRIVPETSGSADVDQNWTQLGQQVSGRAFFGEIEVQEDAPEVVEVVEAPDTSLNLSLQAVIAQGGGAGYAVVAQRSGSGKVFGIGDDLYGQATLNAVYGDRIVIERQGQLETLRYERVRSNALLQPIDDAPVNVGVDQVPESFQEALATSTQALSQGGDLQAQVQGMVNFVQQRANEDPMGFITEMGLQVAEGGNGYAVTRGARQLQMIGLRPGDIVSSVNDMPVGNVQSDLALLNQILQTGGELKIQIMRGSRSFTIYQSIPTF